MKIPTTVSLTAEQWELVKRKLKYADHEFDCPALVCVGRCLCGFNEVLDAIDADPKLRKMLR